MCVVHPEPKDKLCIRHSNTCRFSLNFWCRLHSFRRFAGLASAKKLKNAFLSRAKIATNISKAQHQRTGNKKVRSIQRLRFFGRTRYRGLQKNLPRDLL